MTDRESLAQYIFQSALERGPTKSTCPSEIARGLFPEDWRNHMGDVRDVAIILHKQGKVKLMQKGKVIDPDHIKGPVRIQINDR